jgi:hypothetical protein
MFRRLLTVAVAVAACASAASTAVASPHTLAAVVSQIHC